jgi:hypothetical protein
MKKILYTFCFLFFTATTTFAQDDGRDGEKIPERMTEYIQRRLGLNRAEAERFQPVFLNYFNDLRKTTREHKSDKLVMQQKVTELRLRYRDQFKPIMGEKRSNDVFAYERDFIDEVKKIQIERSQNRKHNLSEKKRLGGPLQD